MGRVLKKADDYDTFMMAHKNAISPLPLEATTFAS